MRIPRSRLGWLDVVCIGLILLSIYVFAIQDIKLDSAFIPTVVNGISSLTGIIIGLCSILIVSSMTQREGKFIKGHGSHIYASITGLLFSTLALISAYSELQQARTVSAVRASNIGLLLALVTFFEYFFFFDTRILAEMRK